MIYSSMKTQIQSFQKYATIELIMALLLISTYCPVMIVSISISKLISFSNIKHH